MSARGAPRVPRQCILLGHEWGPWKWALAPAPGIHNNTFLHRICMQCSTEESKVPRQ